MAMVYLWNLASKKNSRRNGSRSYLPANGRFSSIDSSDTLSARLVTNWTASLRGGGGRVTRGDRRALHGGEGRCGRQAAATAWTLWSSILRVTLGATTPGGGRPALPADTAGRGAVATVSDRLSASARTTASPSTRMVKSFQLANLSPMLTPPNTALEVPPGRWHTMYLAWVGTVCRLKETVAGKASASATMSPTMLDVPSHQEVNADTKLQSTDRSRTTPRSAALRMASSTRAVDSPGSSTYTLKTMVSPSTVCSSSFSRTASV
mmetsp:Transcript_12399/g.26094  ORF Transcript_12399/g.26094 Transcript_12399/m.26094 type:complete len:265 (+) Transcript_12399:465-1259(+)